MRFYRFPICCLLLIALLFSSVSSQQVFAATPAESVAPETAASSKVALGVLAVPGFTGFSPMSGPVGTDVTIAGTNLADVTNVRFNGVEAVFSLNAGVITATVPATATTGAITLISPDGNVASKVNFTVGEYASTLTPGATLPALTSSRAAWGDYDNDGDLDLVVTGLNGSTPTTRLYRNNSGTLELVASSGLANVYGGAIAWGDFDSDGDLDLLLSGFNGSQPVTTLYRNTGGVFGAVSIGFPGLKDSAAAWGDFDNDGDLDLLIAGATAANVPTTALYRNTGGTFAAVTTTLPNVTKASVAMIDFDNDSDLDIFLSGATSDTAAVTKFFRNNGDGSFTDLAVATSVVPGLYNGSNSWADFDNDGDMDLVVSGQQMGSTKITRILRTNITAAGAAFVNQGVVLPGVANGNLEWGDLDNDGTFDLLVSGTGDDHPITTVYRYVNNTTFTAAAPLMVVSDGTATFADLDQDKDLDVFVMGSSLTGPAAQLYSNAPKAPNPANTPPAVPGSPSASLLNGTENGVPTFKWTAPADNKTTANRLTYNLRIGKADGTWDVMPPMSLANGTRLISSPGNAGSGITMLMRGLPNGTYYWGVQAIDSSYSASAFTATGTLVVQPVVYFDKATYTVGENGGTLDIIARVAGNFSSNITAPYTVADGVTNPATNGVDYVLANGSLTFAPGETEKTITVTINDDTLAEAHETFKVTLGTPTNAGLGSPSETVVTITDNDGFEDSGLTIAGYSNDAMAWGDYDSDGTLDIAYVGLGTGNTPAVRILKGSGTGFAAVNTGTSFQNFGVYDSPHVEWVDYDGDGDLDLFLMGRDNVASESYVTRIYRKDAGNVYTNIAAPLATGRTMRAAWADIDNNGTLDLLIAGMDPIGVNAPKTHLYLNNGGVFTEVTGAGLPVLKQASMAFADYDNDGDKDLFFAGIDATNTYKAFIFRNDGFGKVTNTFVNINANLTALAGGSAAWGDYNDDGYLDLLLTGCQADTTCHTKIYRNNGSGGFVDSNISLPGATGAGSSWGDFNNDGKPDLLLTGIVVTDGSATTRVYRNEGAGNFTELMGLPGNYMGPSAWGDYNKDLNLDLITSVGTTTRNLKVFKNLTTVANQAPVAPENLREEVRGTSVTFNWDAASDAQSSVAGLSYNLKVWEKGTNNEVIPSHSRLVGGTRLVPARGNVGHTLTHKVYDLQPDKTYVWTVQTVDSAYVASAFAVTREFTTTGPAVLFVPYEYSVDEHVVNVTINVELTNPVDQVVTVDYTTVDGTATAGEGDYTPVSGKLTFAANEVKKTITVAITNDLLNELAETFKVVLSNPVNIQIPEGKDAATITIIDNDIMPFIAFELDQIPPVLESAEKVTLKVNLETVSGRDISFHYRTLELTAKNDNDFVQVTKTKVTVPKGQTSVSFDIFIVNDQIDEDDQQTFQVELFDLDGVSLKVPALATITIVDDDAPPVVSFTKEVFEVGETVGDATITVQLSIHSERTIEVTYSVIEYTADPLKPTPAKVGSDFAATSGKLTFTPGMTAHQFKVPIINDNTYEEQIEEAILRLSGFVNVSYDKDAILRILDNDPFPTVEFDSTSIVGYEGDRGNFVVKLSNPSAFPVVVTYDISAASTATPNVDYKVPAVKQVTINPGSTTGVISIELIKDDDDPGETIVINLLEATGATLQGKTTATLTIMESVIRKIFMPLVVR